LEEDLCMKAIWDNTIIAESDDIVMLENNHYFPRDAVGSDYLKESGKTYECVWKGMARYFHVVVGDVG